MTDKEWKKLYYSLKDIVEHVYLINIYEHECICMPIRGSGGWKRILIDKSGDVYYHPIYGIPRFLHTESKFDLDVILRNILPLV